MSDLFFALWPDDLVRKQIANVIVQLPDKGNKVSKANLHVKLAHLDSITPDPDVSSDLESSAKRIEHYIQAAEQISASPFKLKLDSREWWRHSKTTAIGSSELPDELFDLINSLNQALLPLGYDQEDQPFRLNITLMDKVEHPISPVHFEPILWLVRGFSLIECSKQTDLDVFRVIQSWDFVG